VLDHTIVTTILARHFPTATAGVVDAAARDLVLLDLLSDDRVLIWEDARRDRHDPRLTPVVVPDRRLES
jgi:hypothetical protein